MRRVTDTRAAETTFPAIADPTRRALLDLLRRGDMRPAGEMAKAFPISRPAISKHLRILRRADLVREHRRGRHRIYQLNPEPLREVERWVADYRVFWQTRLQHLKQFVEENPKPKSARPGTNKKKSKRRDRAQS